MKRREFLGFIAAMAIPERLTSAEISPRTRWTNGLEELRERAQAGGVEFAQMYHVSGNVGKWGKTTKGNEISAVIDPYDSQIAILNNAKKIRMTIMV